MLLASNLHALGVNVVTDIDHIKWASLPYETLGFKFVDIHILTMSKLGDSHIANQLVAEAQVRQTMLQPAVQINMFIDRVRSTHRLRTPRQPNVLENHNCNNKGVLVIGATEKTFEKPPSVARRTFEKKLQKRWEAMQKKEPVCFMRTPSPVEIGQMSMVARDRRKIEHVLDRCWDFFIAWCKKSKRYEMLFAKGEPCPDEIALQRDCFRNGSAAHKSISQ